MSSSRLISCRCFFRRIERALLSPKHILSFALTPRLFCHQILTPGKLWARLCERIRWWANDFVCSFQKLALRCPICRCREGRGRSKGAVALDQFFQFGHIPAEIAHIAAQVVKAFPDLREMIAQALFHETRSLTKGARGPRARSTHCPLNTNVHPSHVSRPEAGPQHPVTTRRTL